MSRNSPKVELLWWEGCPSWGRALAELREAMAQLGIDPNSVTLSEVPSDQHARREAFVGSPTIRVQGRDIQPPAEQEAVGVTCRIYRLRDGRVSPTPDPADVRDALCSALRRQAPA